MAKTNQTKKTTSDAVPTPVESQVNEVEQDTWSPGDAAQKFVVVRGGSRVSDKEYPIATHPSAIAERDFWQRVVTNFPDGTHVEILPYDKKRHRVW